VWEVWKLTGLSKIERAVTGAPAAVTLVGPWTSLCMGRDGMRDVPDMKGRAAGLLLVVATVVLLSACLTAACGVVDTPSDGRGGTGGPGGGGAGGPVGAGGQGGGLGDLASNHPPSMRCSLSSPFGTPVLVQSLAGTSADDVAARLTSDELTVFFSSLRSGDWEIYTATRQNVSSSFSAPSLVTAVNSTMADAFPSVTGDGLTLVLASARNGGVSQILITQRSSAAGTFPAPTAVANVNAGANDNIPFILADGSALLFTSDRSGNFELYRSVKGPSGQFGEPTPIPVVNTPSNEFFPTVSSDDLAIYFSSARGDSPAKGGTDIWMAQRSSISGDYDPPVNVQELNTAADESPNWLSPDNCRLYFTRSGSTGNKIYLAERQR